MENLVRTLIAQGTLRSQHIIDAFLACDRALYLSEEVRPLAYMDQALPIGYEQTMSQPSTVAFMLELLAAHEGDSVLDVGSGSGWSTALLAHIVGPTGSVLGLERVQPLVTFGQENLTRSGITNARIERAGTELGAPEHAPFDRILVSAAARTFPGELVSQLKEHGTLVLPVKHAIWKVVRVEHQPLIEKHEGFVFVPLIT